MLLGQGCNSKVYAVDDQTVVMVGKFERDMFKLAVHAMLGKLHSIQVKGDTYNAVIERMFDNRFMNDTELNMIYDLMDTVDRLNLQNHDGYEFLSKLCQQSNGDLQTVSNFVLSLKLSLNTLDFWVDNSPENWMVDSSGNAVPFDLFDFASQDLHASAQQAVLAILSDYMI